MTSILKAIRNILRAMKRATGGLIRKTVEIGGKLVSVLVPGPVAAAEQDYADYEVPEVAQSLKEGYEVEHAIYDAAVELLGGGELKPETAERITADQLKWLSAMPDEMLRKVLCSQPYAVRDHLKGERSIRGVLRFERAAIDEYIEAMARQPIEESEWKQERAPSLAMAFS